MEHSINDGADGAIIRVLEHHGYVVILRHSTWWECLLERGAERWLGSGGSEASALDDALRCALPSSLGRMLFSHARAVSGRTSEPEHDLELGVAVGREPKLQQERDSELELESGCFSEPDGPSFKDVQERVDPLTAEIVTRGSDLLEPATDNVTTLIPHSPPSIRPVSRPGRRLPSMGVDDGLEALANHLGAIRAASAEVAGWVPKWQRFQILAWIAGARAFQDSVGDSRVTDAVAEVARELGHFSAIWWPGNVPALQVNAYAAECSNALELNSEEEAPCSWLEVAELAEISLERSMQRAEAAGSDERGWMDSAACHPPPPDSPAILAQVRNALEEWTGPLEERPGPTRPGSLGSLSPVDLARRLRWLRLVTIDPGPWGAAMGRLRWLCSRLEWRDRESLSSTLDPSFSPVGGWARLLGHDPERRHRNRRKREVLRASPREGDGQSTPEILEWLRSALDCEDLAPARLADLVQPIREIVLDLDPTSFVEGRRGRRRVRKLVDCLRNPGEHGEAEGRESAAESEVDQGRFDAPESTASMEIVRDAQEAMLEVVLPHTRGKKALVVGNRLDPELDEMLRRTFEFSDLDHKLSGSRRNTALSERIRSGRYDLVLSITGFQYHSTDHALAAAASSGGVAYVRTNRGRPLACIQALFRDLGLATSGS